MSLCLSYHREIYFIAGEFQNIGDLVGYKRTATELAAATNDEL